jgi:hypothetical protein
MKPAALARLIWLSASIAICCGCGAAPLFRDAPPVWQVDDDRDIAEPSEREYEPKEYFAKVFVLKPIDRLLELRREQPARNTNALEEVPDSTWFRNRIGVRRVTPGEAARAVYAGGPPRAPFTITGAKLLGGSQGFLMKDATGRKFLVKFDTEENPELETSAGVIVNRIFWTLGYNVPSDHVFNFRKEQLELDPSATYVDSLKHVRAFDGHRLDALLFLSPKRADGSIRAFASQLLDGTPKGGFSADGTRSDDPNDQVPHEHRRELRGLRVFAAWVGHTDMKEDDSIDVFVERGGRRYLEHYLLDFNEALAGHAAEKGRSEDGWEHFIDWEMQTKATFAFGLWKRPWEDVKATPWPSIGSFSAEPFEPRAWREAYPYWPFAEMDAADAYWAAKLVMRFDRPLLTAIVAEGKLSEPAAADYLVRTLLARRDAVGRAYLDAVTALDDFTLAGRRLCMTDLSVRYGFAQGGVVEWLNGARVLTTRPLAQDGRVCVLVPMAENYGIFRMRIRRGAQNRPAMELHFKAGAHARILGLIRVAP